MKKLVYIGWIVLVGVFAACSEEDIVPTVDTTPEYAAQLKANAGKSQADSMIYQWYKKFGMAVLYDFSDADITWLWAGKFRNSYSKFDLYNAEDVENLHQLVSYIEEGFLKLYDEDFLKENLPYKMFLVKELHKTSNAESDLIAATSNGQEAFIIGCERRKGKPFFKSQYEKELGNIFGTYFYDNLPAKPEKFLSSRVECKFRLVTWPVDKSIADEMKTKPDWKNDQHSANVCGYVKGYGSTGVFQPTEAQDYTDFLTFITKNKGSYIRQHTSYYWRLAKRSVLFIKFFKEVQKRDLIAEQNAHFPDDQVKLSDFDYKEK